MSNSLLDDDKYDALSQGQNTTDFTAIGLEMEMEECQVDQVTTAINTINKSAVGRFFLSKLESWKILKWTPSTFQDGLCAKFHFEFHNDEAPPKAAVKHDDVSWRSLYRPSLRSGNTKDASTLFTLLRARKDRYAVAIASKDECSGCTRDTTSAENRKTDTEIVIHEVFQVPTTIELVEMSPDNLVEMTTSQVEFDEDVTHKSRSTTRVTCSPVTDDCIMDEKLTIEFVEEDIESTDGQEIHTSGAADKYSTKKDVTAFDRMLFKFGLIEHDGKQNDHIDSNHTRTTATSTLPDSTSHTRTFISLDAIFSVNSAIMLTVPSESSEGDSDEGSTDDDSSAWFGYRENCNPNVTVLLAPVSSSRSDDGSTTFLSMRGNEDETADEYTAATIQTSEGGNFGLVVYRSDSDLLPTMTTETVPNSEGNAFYLDLRALLQRYTEMVIQKCGEPFFGGEIETQPSNSVDAEERNDDHSIWAEQPSPVLAGNEILESVLQLVGLENWNGEVHVPQLCCTCSESNSNATVDSATMEEEEISEPTKRKNSQKIGRIFNGCKEKDNHYSDEEGDYGLSVMVDEGAHPISKQTYFVANNEVEIKLEDHIEAVAKADSVPKTTQTFHGLDISSQPEEEVVSTQILDGLDICSQPDEEVKSLLDDPNFKLDSIQECENSRSDDEYLDFEPSRPCNGNDLIGISQSNDSFCIPSPPEIDVTNAENFESHLDSLSFDLSCSSDDLNLPLALLEPNSTTNISASHRRRHTLDRIPSYHSLFDFQKPVILPFLHEYNEKQSCHTPIDNERSSTPSSTEKGKLSIKTGLRDNIRNKARPDTPIGYNLAATQRNKSSSVIVWEEMEDENTPTNHSVTTSNHSKCPCSTTQTTGIVRTIELQPISSHQEHSTIPFVKGILRKEGAKFGSGRRISWNEEQFTNKEEKGILFSSGRQGPRSLCPLDELVHQLSENQDP